MPASLIRGLVAYYPFNDNAKDESGKGRHGTIKSPARGYVTGKLGSGIVKFDRKPNKNAEIFDFRNWLRPRVPGMEWPVGQLKNRQPQNRMRGDLYAQVLLVSGGARLLGPILTTGSVHGGLGVQDRRPSSLCLLRPLDPR